MSYPILGLHHVTATVDDAQADLNFCVDALGLRLVKRTVNFDNHGVYHFYYGDELGRPGTIWTTFPYKGMGVPVGVKGDGQITATTFSVPAGSLDFWKARLRDHGVAMAGAPEDRFGEEAIAFADPSGLVIELVGTNRDDRTAWTGGGIQSDAAVRGLYGVTLTIAAPSSSIEFMSRVLGFDVVQETNQRIRLAVNHNRPGNTIDIVPGGAVSAKNGLGTVHHVAMAISEPDEQLGLREELLKLGYRVTEVLDRQYFQSIYFREPGGVLFEVATTRPGFSIDEHPDQLGCALKLPPWEEPNRKMIEQSLPPIETSAHR
jgi:glyoxalase family protein